MSNLTTLDQLADAIYDYAQEKGWHIADETEDALLERVCNNLHNEVCELHEAWRNNQLRDLCDKAEKMVALGLPPLTCLEEECADIVIRALHQSRELGVDILRAVQIKHAFNLARPHRHGGKRS